MLCAICTKFTADILRCDFSTWRKVNEDGLFTLKHGTHHEIQTWTAQGCALGELLSTTRGRHLPRYHALGEKWLMKPASIDVTYGGEGQVSSFKFMTIAPQQRSLEFEFFSLAAREEVESLQVVNRLDIPGRIPQHPCNSISTAKGWIKACDELHSNTGTSGSSAAQTLPTRVLDVGTLPEELDVRLHLCSRGESGRYVTLSHCWGATGERLTTTRANVDQHCSAIAFGSLPATFRDAVVVARQLGFRYLWIDALCIIQDDEQDWRREAEAMHLTFANATLSVSALDAQDSSAGFLGPRDQKIVELSIGQHATIGLRHKAMSSTEGITTSLLETRAWCLQERLLPSRVLFFGREQLYWRCRTSQASEADPAFTTQAPSYKPQALKLIDGDDPDLQQDAWLDVLTQYSERLLSVPRDRVPALLGLAAFAEAKPPAFRMLHGMPLQDMHKSLLWRRRLWQDHKTRPEADRGFLQRASFFARENILYQAEQSENNSTMAPSWSWANLNKPVNWYWRYTLPRQSQCQLDVTLATEALFDRKPQGIMMSIDLGPNVYDDQCWILGTEGHIRRGTCKVTISLQNITENAVFTAPFGPGKHRSEIGCTLDRPPSFTATSCYALYVTAYGTPDASPVSRTSTGLSGSSTSSSRSRRKRRGTAVGDQAFVLLLERVADWDGSPSSIFKRIGIGQAAKEEVQAMFKGTPRTEFDFM